MELKGKAWQVALVAGLLISSAAAIAAVAQAAGTNDPELVKAALSERLPKTEITAIDCEKIKGVCEVQARQNQV